MMNGKIRACCRGFQDPVVACKYNKGFDDRVLRQPWTRNEELLCAYHQLLVKYLSPNEREKSSKQL